jgi:carboxylesterase
MPTPAHLDPSAYSVDAGPVGALLIHGFTGSVSETRPMGQYLADRGVSVRCPLLPGHGTASHDLTRIRWQAWAGEVEAAFWQLRQQCETVFVGGLSLGSLLALWLGAQHPEIGGLIAMAPAVQVRSQLIPLTLALRYVLKYSPVNPMSESDMSDPTALERAWCYDELPLWGASEVYLVQRKVRSLLPRIGQPILIFQGRGDVQLTPQAAQMLYDRVASTDKTLIWLEHSGHNLLIDGERESVFARSHGWIVERAYCPQAEREAPVDAGDALAEHCQESR